MSLAKTIRHPARLVPLAFLSAISVGTLILMLPVAKAGAGSAPFFVALFTSTSAVCVTGLILVDTPTYWSAFGQSVILALIQIGGFGIMTGATLLGVLLTRKVRLSGRLLAQAETKTLALGDVRAVISLIFKATLLFEFFTAIALTLRFAIGHNQSVSQATWNGVFQAVSAFNNAGFATFSDSMTGFALDPFLLVPIMVAVIIGGIGFPVLYELKKEFLTPQKWSLHTKITLLGTGILLPLGAAATLLGEWANPSTLGPLPIAAKFLNAAFHSVMTRTAGFNSLNLGDMNTETLAVTYALMFIGGGSAGTAGGIKVTTFLLLGYAVWAEIRGEADATAFRRRVASGVQRQALTVLLLAVGLVAAGTLVLLVVSDHALEDVLFEAVSAFATVGLSTGITADLPQSGHLVLVLLMFVGRVGTITAATALALQSKQRPFRYPQERPIVG